MKLIIITAEGRPENEIETLQALLSEGASIHIRKPGYDSEAVSELLDKLPQEYYKQLTVHGNHQVAEAFCLCGIHLRSKEEELKIPVWEGRLSKSFHSFEEAKSNKLALDYGFISPVFNSISKKGYGAKFSQEGLRNELAHYTGKTPLYALGGIDASNINILKQLGMAGAAVLGSIWDKNSLAERLTVYKNLRRLSLSVREV